MAKLHVAFVLDGGPAVPTYANRSMDALYRLLKIFTGRSFRIRTFDVPTTAATVAALIEDKLKVLAKLTALNETTITVGLDGKIKQASPPATISAHTPPHLAKMN